MEDLAESGSYKTVFRKQERIKQNHISAIAQNGRATQNVISDAENVRKSTVQNTSVQNTRGNKKNIRFSECCKKEKRAVNNVSESSFYR